MNEEKITPAVEETTATETTEQTIGEVLTPETKPAVENTIPEHKFLEEKKGRKEAERKVKELQELIQSGASKKEISEDMDAIAKEYDIDPTFLEKLEKTIRSKSEKDIEDKFSLKFKPLEEKERKEKIDKAFQEHFQNAIKSLPEFEKIVNPEIIKSLSLLPQNASKTFSQLIEETYGNAITGKRSIPSTVYGGGKEAEPLDIERAGKDIEYLKEVLADPKKKEQYNSQMLKKGW